jgi:hypothetical protein
MTRNRLFGLLSVTVVLLTGACGGTTCDSIQVKTQVFGPTEGTTTLCVQPLECREDVMAGLVATEQCKKTDNDCGRGDKSCALNQLCKVQGASDPGLVVTSVTWDRENACEKPAGTHKCTAKWKVPAGSGLHCACGCAQ